ncbi:Uncharacterised protein [Raoultella terrigena]|uniref:Uncharacterized protein n=1 Tax=Raoultella terrigena TaxID=577 RepID=A0A3P8JXG0_RAOTE|nr:Uncharacterised protein [Raoultella terrigena]
MEDFSERLLREHQQVWQAMQQHRFVVDIEQDSLPETVFNRYLVLRATLSPRRLPFLPLASARRRIFASSAG